MKSYILVSIGLAAVLLLPSPGQANFWLFRHRPVVTSYYYATPIPVAATPVYPVPVVTTPVYPIPTVSPVPVVAPPACPPAAAGPLYAQPVPAPPSVSVQPPLVPRPASPMMPPAGEQVLTRRPRGDVYDVHYVDRPGPARPAGQRCEVMFWNLSGSDVTLYVEGQVYQLAAGRSVRLDVNRDFTWNTDASLPHRQQVPTQESGLEIVIRG